MTLELAVSTRLTGQQDPQDPSVLAPRCWDYSPGMCLNVHAEGLKSGGHACTSITVPTELFPQPPVCFNSSSSIKTILIIFFAEFSFVIHFEIV